MHSLDFKLEEGIKGQYRVVAYFGLNEMPLTEWHANATSALAAFGDGVHQLTAGKIADQITKLEESVDRLNRNKATKA